MARADRSSFDERVQARARFRARLLRDYRRRCEALFGCPCDDEWLRGWAGGIAHLREQDRRARALRAQGSVERARAFLAEIGAAPGMLPAPALTGHAYALRVDVEEALGERRTVLPPVKEVPRDVPKLTSSGVDGVILFFECHSDAKGEARWLTDQELAVLSLVLDPERIRVTEGEVESKASPADILERETKNIKRSRKLIGELRTEEQKEVAVKASKEKRQPRRKPVPAWAEELRTAIAVPLPRVRDRRTPRT